VAVRGRLRPDHGLPTRRQPAAVLVAGVLTFALAATGLATGAALPAGRVFALSFVGLVGGLTTLAVARSGRAGPAGPGPVVAGLGLAGVAGCVGLTAWYLAEYPLTHQGYPPTISATLPPVTAAVLAVVLAACLWLALRPPRWLLPDRPARRFGVAMALALVAGFVLSSRLGLRGGEADAGAMSYLPGRCDLVDADRDGAVGAAPGRARRRRRQRPGPPPGPRARRPRAQRALSRARSSFPTEFLGRRSTNVTAAGAWWAARCRRP
jgi:hypothetical protein